MKRALLCVAVCALCASLARADTDKGPGPAPDPSRYERSDGKISDGTNYDILLLIPRMLLVPPRVAINALGKPVRWVVDFEDRYHLIKTVATILTSEDGKRGVRPVFRYISRLQPQIGLVYFDKKLMGPDSLLSVTFGAVMPALLFAETSIHPRLPGHMRGGLDVGYLKRDDLLFAGVGLASFGRIRANQNPLARVAIQALNISGSFETRLVRLLTLHVAEVWSLRSYGNGRHDNDLGDNEAPIAQVYCRQTVHPNCLLSSVDPALVPGFYTGADFLATDAALIFDTRAATYSRELWFRAELGGRFAQTPSTTGPSWIRGHATAAVGIPLDTHGRFLIARVTVEMLQPIKGTVPFTELVLLGGADDLRGAPYQRFRDFSSTLGTLEYRWPVWMWMDASLFTDWGGTFGKHLGDFAFDRLVPDVGAGLVLHTKRNFLMRFQLAYGYGTGWQFLFSTATGL